MLKLNDRTITRNIRKNIEELYGDEWIDSCGICAIGSIALYTAFKFFNYKSIIYKGNIFNNDKNLSTHVWIERNNYIYDLTFAQFKNQFCNYKSVKDVLIIPVDCNFADKHFKNKVEVKNLNHEFKTWPLNQRPSFKTTCDLIENIILPKNSNFINKALHQLQNFSEKATA